MAADLKLLPQGERFLSGKLSSGITAIATTMDVNNPPAASKLPTYLEIDYGTDEAEVVRVIDVSGNTLTIERGVNSGGVGVEHLVNANYKQKITNQFVTLVTSAIENGWLPEDTSYTFTRVTTSSFKVTASGVDRTGLYSVGRRIRLNGSTIVTISSSSYSNPDTTVSVKETTVPTPITSIELEIGAKGKFRVVATGAEINTGTDDEKIITPKAIKDALIYPSIDEDDMASDLDTKVPTQQSVKAYSDLHGISMARQAIMNGNFDVWQRGTTGSPVDGITLMVADHWGDFNNRDGGTLPTLTRTRQTLTSGDIPNAFYFSRLTTNGAGSSLGANSLGVYFQKIEHGTRFLAGAGKKITVSFWAKSDIANKKIGVYLAQDYGSGGSPTSQEIINGTNWTLTSSWTKYTYTFTLNTLSGKTFGTNNYDSILVHIANMWGTSGAVRVGAGSTAETYVGSGNIDVAQVQVCAGEVALPFQPRSFGEELRLCQRYYEKIGGYVGQTYCRFGNGHCRTTTSLETLLIFKVPKRDNSYTLETSGTASDYAVYVADSVIQANGVPALVSQPESNIYLCPIRTSVASGLTVGQGGSLISNNNATAFLAINNEF